MSDTFSDFCGLTIREEPRGISFRTHGDIGDDPAKHRWRAVWDSDYGTSMPVGIMMYAYPVLKTTYGGAWIDHLAFWEQHKASWWISGKKRLIMNKSGAGWAKPTKEEALASLSYRLLRWAQASRRDMHRVKCAIEVTERLIPDRKHYAEMAKDVLS